MVDLVDVIGENPLRASIARKRQKEAEKLEKLMIKVRPLQANLGMYDKMLAAIDENVDGVTEFSVDEESEDEPVGTASAESGDRLAGVPKVRDFEPAADTVKAGAPEEEETYDRAPIPPFLRNKANG